MIGLIITIHVIVCLLLIGLILIQRGRGGGLVESFSGVESMFGTKTNTFLARTTTALSIIFFLTCLALAFSSVRQSRSLMKEIKTESESASTEKKDIPSEEPSSNTLPQGVPKTE